MIKHIAFENFRGLKKAELKDLSQLTLISGRNNAGKSTVLEGIFLSLDHLSPDSFLKINSFRNAGIYLDAANIWTPLFYNMNTSVPIKISLSTDDDEGILIYSKNDNFVPRQDIASKDVLNRFIAVSKASYSLHFEYDINDYHEKGDFMVSDSGVLRDFRTNLQNDSVMSGIHAQYVNSNIAVASDLTDWLGKMELHGEKERVIDVLRLIEPDITDIVTIIQQSAGQIYYRKGSSKNLIPLKFAGDGINRLLFIILSIIENPGSVILIDEIEIGFHYSIYNKLWAAIASAAAEYNCQVIATTHSYECIGGALQGIEDAGLNSSFGFYRIAVDDGICQSFRYERDELEFAFSSNMEVR